MTDAEETLLRLDIYLRNRIGDAQRTAAHAPMHTPAWHWAHTTSQELDTVLQLLSK